MAAKKKQHVTAAYWVVDVEGGFGIALCVEGENGYHPCAGYGPYTEKRAQSIADRLNEGLGHGPPDTLGHRTSVRRVVGSTMGIQA